MGHPLFLSEETGGCWEKIGAIDLVVVTMPYSLSIRPVAWLATAVSNVGRKITIEPARTLTMNRFLLAMLFLGLSTATAGADTFPEPAQLERFIAIDNVCAWPNLTVLRDGTLVATIFNQPSHGSLTGDVECWASQDGRFWKRVGTPAPHEPDTNRMNVAAGLALNGDLLVLSSGWSNQQQPGQPKQDPFRDARRARRGGRDQGLDQRSLDPNPSLRDLVEASQDVQPRCSPTALRIPDPIASGVYPPSRPASAGTLRLDRRAR